MFSIEYTFDSLLSLNSTHLTFEAPNLITTFVSMLIFIILSFVDWRLGWVVFCMGEDGLSTCTP